MNVARTYKTVAFSVPPGMATQIEETVKRKQLTKSEFFREMFRIWEKKEREERESDEQIVKLFAEVKEEQKRNPRSKEELLLDFEELSRELSDRAKALGLEITEDGEILEKRA